LWRIWIVLAIAACCAVAIALHDPIPQDPAYHHFADRHELLAVPNFWNVASNLPFLAAGMTGLIALRSKKAPGTLPTLRWAYIAFFASSIFVGVGSACYHLAPNNTTLAWDRLAMTISFMAFLTIIVGEHINASLGQKMLLPFLVIGMLSVIFWRITEANGQGDLRFYVMVQFLPLAIIPVIVILFQSALTRIEFIWAVLAAYAVGKAFEFFDGQIYITLNMSGHTLKHLMAAAGVYFMALAVQKRFCRVKRAMNREP
jgi:predicted membrane channel-forming protein YqfA (hemolysin III family)